MLKFTKANVSKVVLMTYFRGGSTFLGELLNQNQDAFYMFEPLLTPFDRWISREDNFGVHAPYMSKSGAEMYNTILNSVIVK